MPGRERDDWDRFEEALLGGGRAGHAGRRGLRTSAARSELGAAFDAAELADLRRIAALSRSIRSRSKPLGNVVFLPGITGSDLAVRRPTGGEDGVWINPLRLMDGRVADLRLDADGAREASPGVHVRPTGLNRRFYARTVLSLRARWNVATFAYDWRRDIDEASDGLAQLLRTSFPGQPAHLLAHSLGGLVARNFILRHREQWDGLRAPDLAAGGRLLMLGTPNYGSFAIPPVLAGTDRLIELLQRLDLRHNLPELLAITNSFVGTYLLLPAPSKLTAAQMSLYRRDSWGRVPAISQRHLDRASRFFDALESGATIDPARMIYVAGCRYVTITSMQIVAPGEFDYTLGVMGDGRVPHALGLLPDVPAYYVEEVHGDLARNETVLRAADQLLQTGRSDMLATAALRSRSLVEPRMRDYRAAADPRLLAAFEKVTAKARRAGSRALTADDERTAADALMHAALGSNARSALPDASGAAAAAAATTLQSPVDAIRLRVGVRFGDVTTVKAPVVVVGHYRGVEPVNAIGAIDAAMGRWITRAVQRGQISGQLGETCFLPARAPVAADWVVVAGMGDYGQFTPLGLRRLMANVAIGIAALGLTRMATVLVGAGEGSLDRDVALTEALEGIGAGLIELRDETGGRVALQEIVLVERNPARFFQLLRKLQSLQSDASLVNLRLSAVPALPADMARARRTRSWTRDTAQARRRNARTLRSQRPFDEVRIAIECEPDRQLLRFSALTQAAVVPVREVVVNLRNAREAAQALRDAGTPHEQAQYGRLLHTYLIPADFRDLLGTATPVRLILDAAAAAYPWEMACCDGNGQGTTLRWLGTDCGLSRQFKTLLSTPPCAFTPPLNHALRVLVIADPAPEPALQLAGARIEGRRLVESLNAIDATRARGALQDIQVDQRIGAGECDFIEILALLLSGDYDIVHFAGHGDFDPEKPERSGWVFGADRVLTAVDIARCRRVPRLVFANACFSGALRDAQGKSPLDTTPGLGSIAQAFLERGVPNYIGTGWPVDDAQAVKISQCFYDEVIRGKALGPALQVARKSVFAEGLGSSWGAYQLYGNPGDTVVRAPAGRTRSNTSAKAPGNTSSTAPKRRRTRSPRR